MKEILSELHDCIDAIEGGNVTKEKLDVTIKKINDLQELLIILRYKCYESERKTTTIDHIESNIHEEERIAKDDFLEFDLRNQDGQESDDPNTSKISKSSFQDPQFVNQIMPSNEEEKQVLRIIKLIQTNRKIIKQESFVKMFLLHEKLMFINELFDGSSESFAKAIRSIDSLNEFEEVLKELAKLSYRFHWDIETETVEEFIFKVCCRFA